MLYGYTGNGGDMGHNSKRGPRWAGEWIAMWERDRAMYVPAENGGIESIELERVRRLDGRYADALVKPKEGSRFYVVFRHSRVYRPLNLPLLVHPVKDGALVGFWIMPGREANVGLGGERQA